MNNVTVKVMIAKYLRVGDLIYHKPKPRSGGICIVFFRIVCPSRHPQYVPMRADSVDDAAGDRPAETHDAGSIPLEAGVWSKR